ncbi:MAG: toxin glutamine deamidase domain-containing protein [Planctomycetota bacterium]
MAMSFCLEPTIHVDDLLAGTGPLSPAGASDALDFNRLERIFGPKFSDVLSADDLLKNLSTTSRGDRGIVFGISEKIDCNTIGHFFNFANPKDIVRFLDGQTGTAGDLAKFSRFRFLRTS